MAGKSGISTLFGVVSIRYEILNHTNAHLGTVNHKKIPLYSRNVVKKKLFLRPCEL